MAKEKAEVANKQPQQEQKVINISQAISVLLQATDIGRSAGIYTWEDLELISQARNVLTGKKSSAPKTEKTEELKNVPSGEEKVEEPSTEDIATEE